MVCGYVLTVEIDEYISGYVVWKVRTAWNRRVFVHRADTERQHGAP